MKLAMIHLKLIYQKNNKNQYNKKSCTIRKTSAKRSNKVMRKIKPKKVAQYAKRQQSGVIK